MARLTWQTDQGQPAQFVIGQSPVRVGRGEGNDLVIADPSVSTNHAELSLDGANLAVRDLGSTNGTFAFDQRVQQVLIEPGQVFRFGNVELTFEGAATPEAKTTVAAPPVPSPIRARLSVAHSPAAATAIPALEAEYTAESEPVTGPVC